MQRVGHTGSVYAGTFTLTFDGQTTAAIAFNASAADVRSALEALSNIDSGDITVTKVQDSPRTAHEWQIVFRGNKAGTNVRPWTGGVFGAGLS